MSNTTSTPTRFIFFSLAFLALFAALAAFMPDMALASDDFGMGGEREPVMCSALLSIITGIIGVVERAWLTAILAVVFHFAVVYVFRQMAKADPVMTRVWRRFVAYRSYYRARSPYWEPEAYRK